MFLCREVRSLQSFGQFAVVPHLGFVAHYFVIMPISVSDIFFPTRLKNVQDTKLVSDLECPAKADHPSRTRNCSCRTETMLDLETGITNALIMSTVKQKTGVVFRAAVLETLSPDPLGTRSVRRPGGRRRPGRARLCVCLLVHPRVTRDGTTARPTPGWGCRAGGTGRGDVGRSWATAAVTLRNVPPRMPVINLATRAGISRLV